MIDPEGTSLRAALEVGGVRIAVEGPEGVDWGWPRGPIARFVRSRPEVDVELAARVASLEGVGSRAGHACGSSFDLEPGPNGWQIRLRIRGRVVRVVRVDREFARGELLLDPDSFYVREAYYPLAYPLDELLVMHRAPRLGGMLVHAAAVVRRGRAALFVGRSGAGKTTLARLVRRRAAGRILSDDRVLIRRSGDLFRAHGTPWHGDEPLADPGRAPLDALYLIHHAPKLRLRRLHPAAAAAALLPHVFVPLADPVAVERVLELVAELVARVSVFTLGFRPDPEVVDFLWRPATAERPDGAMRVA